MKLKNCMLNSLLAVPAIWLLAGCQSTSHSCCAAAKTETPAVAAAPAAAPAKPATVVPVTFPLRIKAGQDTPYTDASGNVWLAERGFADGDVIDRGTDVEVLNTKDQGLYRSEHYSMTEFSQPLPNGKYTVKLHFCETFEGIEGPGQRVFSFNVGGQEFKDFDVWVKAGGPRKPYVETVNTEVTTGKLVIKFTSNVENPQINAIEIIPAS